MSRIVVFDDNGVSLGELQANCSRSWAINEGGQAVITLAAEQVMPWLQFGRMVMVEHPELPTWAGMIDTPWMARLPVQVSVYNCEYLLAIRSPDAPVTLTGSYGERAMQAINVANGQEDLLIREGEVDKSVGNGSEVLEVKPIWEQVVSIAKRAGLEIQLRAVRDLRANRLQILFDMKKLGGDTGLLLHDGKKGNMEITDAQVEGEIWNRVVGVGDQSSQQSRLTTTAKVDDVSVGLYRMRSQVVQYDGVVRQSTLERNTLTALGESAYPRLYLAANVLDVGGIFASLRLGNGFEVQAANVVLPGGVVGWRGQCRVMGMAYDETRNSIGVVLEGSLNAE